MVEFGLKLEDNKVSEWSDQYLNYEKLKTILKKAKVAQKKYEEQAKKRPEDAAKIRRAVEAGNTAFVLTTPHASSNNLLANVEEANERSSLLQPQQQQQQPPTQGSPSGDNKREYYSSDDASSSMRTSPSEKHKGSYMAALSNVSDFFGSRYERCLRDYLKEMENREKEFEDTLVGEVKKVSDFYYSKLEELEHRLQLLIETVAASFHIDTTLPTLATDIAPTATPPATPLQIERKGGVGGRGTGSVRSLAPKAHSIMEMVNKLQVMMKRHDAAERLSVANDSDDEGDGPTIGGNMALPKDGDKLGEADSIKRALIDQYRTSKLLHNYAIMNYTGFVKIVKKHDKTLPEKKGRYKATIAAKNLCEEGRAVEELSERYEKYYANWFCDGDVRSAHAQMLPKRGDGLEMDWSQLR